MWIYSGFKYLSVRMLLLFLRRSPSAALLSCYEGKQEYTDIITASTLLLLTNRQLLTNMHMAVPESQHSMLKLREPEVKTTAPESDSPSMGEGELSQNKPWHGPGETSALGRKINDMQKTWITEHKDKVEGIYFTNNAKIQVKTCWVIWITCTRTLLD